MHRMESTWFPFLWSAPNAAGLTAFGLIGFRAHIGSGLGLPDAFEREVHTGFRRVLERSGKASFIGGLGSVLS